MDKEVVELTESVAVVVKHCVTPVDDGRFYMVQCAKRVTDGGSDLIDLFPKPLLDSWAVNGAPGGVDALLTPRLHAVDPAHRASPT